LWQHKDVVCYSDVVVKNPTHLAIAIQFGGRDGTNSRVIAKYARNVDWWMTAVAADLPSVTDPKLARALYADINPGETIPRRFNEAMRQVFDDAQRQNAAARFCPRFPQGVPQPLPPIPPPDQQSDFSYPGNLPSPPNAPQFPPTPVVPPGRPIGTVFIHNTSHCDFIVFVNGQPLSAPRGRSATHRVYVGPVTTTIATQANSTRTWNHWLIHPSPTLALYAYGRPSEARSSSRPTHESAFRNVQYAPAQASPIRTSQLPGTRSATSFLAPDSHRYQVAPAQHQPAQYMVHPVKPRVPTVPGGPACSIELSPHPPQNTHVPILSGVLEILCGRPTYTDPAANGAWLSQ